MGRGSFKTPTGARSLRGMQLPLTTPFFIGSYKNIIYVLYKMGKKRTTKIKRKRNKTRRRMRGGGLDQNLARPNNPPSFGSIFGSIYQNLQNRASTLKNRAQKFVSNLRRQAAQGTVRALQTVDNMEASFAPHQRDHSTKNTVKQR